MEWINLSITQLAAPEYRRSDYNDRGVWLTLLAYCVQQENLGRIAGAAQWTDFECVGVLNVSRAALEGTHLLWSFDGQDLCVSGYPREKQREIDAKRKAARIGNRKRWHSDSQSASQSASHSDSQSDTDSESRKGKGKGKEREGKEKENGKGLGAARPGQKPASLAEVEAYAREIGLSREEAQTFHDHFEANGWRQGGRTPLRDWRAAARNWQRRALKFSAGGLPLPAKKFAGGGGALAPFDPTKPHAHTGGLQVFEAGGEA